MNKVKGVSVKKSATPAKKLAKKVSKAKKLPTPKQQEMINEIVRNINSLPNLPEGFKDIKANNITQVDVHVAPTPQTPEEELSALRLRHLATSRALEAWKEWSDAYGSREEISAVLSMVRELLEKGLLLEESIPAIQKVLRYVNDENVIKSSRGLIQARVDFFFEPCNPPGISNEEMALRIVEKMKYGDNSEMAYRVGTPVVMGETREVTKVEVLR